MARVTDDMIDKALDAFQAPKRKGGERLFLDTKPKAISFQSQRYRMRKALEAALGPPDPSWVKFRPHRGSLDDAMDELQSFATRADLIQHITDDLGRYRTMPESFADYDRLTKIEPYGYDDRIQWDTYIVTVEGYGVFGFTNGDFPSESHAQELKG